MYPDPICFDPCPTQWWKGGMETTERYIKSQLGVSDYLLHVSFP